MPFPIAAAVGLGATALSGLLGGPKKSQEEKALFREEANRLQYLTQRGQKFDQLATPHLFNILKFYDALARGDRSALSRFYGPQINQIGENFMGATDDAYRFLPRGAAQDFAVAQGRVRQGGDIGRLLSGSPQAGYGGLTSVVSSLLGEGLQSTASASRLPLLRQETEFRESQEQFFDQVVESARGFGAEIWDYLNNKGGKG